MSKYALITGANRGIGKEIARQLGEKEFHVLLGSRSPEKGEAAAEELREAGIGVTSVTLDVADRDGIRRAREAVEEITGRLDVLINNAAILLSQRDTLLDAPAEDILRTVHTNALGALFVTRAFRPLLGESSRVVMVSSGAGALSGGVNSYAPVYSLSKTFMNDITRYLAAELQPAGISVNAVCPGWVRTDMGGPGATRSVEKGAETPVWLATEASAEVTGEFFRDKQKIEW